MMRRIMAGLAGVTGGLLTAAVLSSGLSTLSGPSSPVMVSDVHGALSDICIQYRSDFSDASLETLASFLSALSGSVRVRVIVAERKEFDELLRGLAGRGVVPRCRLLAVETGFAITPWAKDRFVSLRSGEGPVLGVPRACGVGAGPRGNDERVPRRLAADPDLSCRALPFMFDGGDLISDGQTVFVAATALARNPPLDVDDRPGLIATVAAGLGLPVLVLGDSADAVPDHHIGMYLTPLGDGRVAVADPDWGMALYRGGPLPGGVQAERDDRVFARFKTVAAELTAAGYELVRIPLLLTDRPRVWVTYNNAVLEERDGRRQIFMPVYGIPELDAAAKAAFEHAGWDVVEIPVGRLYTYTGSLRCLVGVIGRVAARRGIR